MHQVKCAYIKRNKITEIIAWIIRHFKKDRQLSLSFIMEYTCKCIHKPLKDINAVNKLYLTGDLIDRSRNEPVLTSIKEKYRVLRLKIDNEYMIILQITIMMAIVKRIFGKLSMQVKKFMSVGLFRSFFLIFFLVRKMQIIKLANTCDKYIKKAIFISTNEKINKGVINDEEQFKISASLFVINLLSRQETIKAEELGLPIKIDKRNNLKALSVSKRNSFLKGLKI